MADCLSRCFVDMDKAERVQFQQTVDEDDLIYVIKECETVTKDQAKSVSNDVGLASHNEGTTAPSSVDEGYCCDDINCNHSLCRICNADCRDVFDDCLLEYASLVCTPEAPIGVHTVASLQQQASNGASPSRPVAQADHKSPGIGDIGDRPGAHKPHCTLRDVMMQDGGLKNKISPDFTEMFSAAEIELFSSSENSQSSKLFSER